MSTQAVTPSIALTPMSYSAQDVNVQFNLKGMVKAFETPSEETQAVVSFWGSHLATNFNIFIRRRFDIGCALFHLKEVCTAHKASFGALCDAIPMVPKTADRNIASYVDTKEVHAMLRAEALRRHIDLAEEKYKDLREQLKKVNVDEKKAKRIPKLVDSALAKVAAAEAEAKVATLTTQATEKKKEAALLEEQLDDSADEAPEDEASDEGTEVEDNQEGAEVAEGGAISLGVPDARAFARAEAKPEAEVVVPTNHNPAEKPFTYIKLAVTGFLANGTTKEQAVEAFIREWHYQETGDLQEIGIEQAAK